MIHLYDGNNYARIVWETCSTGQPLRELLAETNSHSDAVMWIFDGFNANDRRRKIFPEYKRQRRGAPDEFYKSIQVLREALVHTNAIQICVPEFEADDVIAELTVMLHQGNSLMIHSTDGDFQALRTLPGVLTTRPHYKEIEDVNHVRIYKVCVGDKSDNIPGIPGFGPKAWATLNKEALIQYLQVPAKDLLQALPLVDRMNVKPGVARWLKDPVSHQLLKNYYEIAGFIPVPYELIERYMTPGVLNKQEQEAILQRVMQ
jgi:5'-3' exonuclease